MSVKLMGNKLSQGSQTYSVSGLRVGGSAATAMRHQLEVYATTGTPMGAPLPLPLIFDDLNH